MTQHPPHETPPGSAESALRGLVLPCLLLLGAMLNLTLIVAGLKELVMDDLGGSAGDASLFFSLEMLAYMVFAPLWGIVSDRLGRRRILVVVGFLASGCFYLSYTHVHSLWLLLALRIPQGACTVMGWSTLMAMVVDHAPEPIRGRRMGMMGGALILGVSLGAPIGGYLSRGLGARAPLTAAGILFLLIAIAALALRDPLHLRRQSTLGETLSTLRGQPRLLMPYLFHFVDRYTVGFFLVVFPLYLGTLGIDDPAVRGRYLALFLLPFALLQIPIGRLIERIGPYKPLIGGSLLYGALLAAVGISDLFSLWWVMGGLGVLAAVMFPPSIVLTARWSSPSTRGSAMGGFNLAGSLGFALGPLVGAWALSRSGYGFAFTIAGALEVLVASGALLWLSRIGRAAEAPAG